MRRTLLYTYRETANAPLDFLVRKVNSPEDQEWPFEVVDVTEGGISYRAGVRDGDRVNGYCDHDKPGQSSPCNWDDASLDALNQLPEGTPVIVFVDKRARLDDEAKRHMIKRLQYISTTKSNLKKQNRLGEFPYFLRRWDGDHCKLGLKRPSSPERSQTPCTTGNDANPGGDAEGQEAMLERTLSNTSNENKTDNTVLPPGDSSESKCDRESGDDSKFDGNDTGGTPDTHMRSDFGEQSSSVVVSSEVPEEFLELHDEQTATAGMSVDEYEAHNEDAEGGLTQSLNEQSDECLTVGSENWNDDEQKCEEDQFNQTASLSGTKKRSSSPDIQGSPSKRRKTANSQARSTDLLSHIGGADSGDRSGHAPQEPVLCEMATTKWDVEPAAESTRKMLFKVAQQPDLTPYVTASYWQSWLQELMHGRFEKEILTRLEKVISAASSKGTCINAYFGECVVWVVSQLSPDRQVLSMELGDASSASFKPSILRESQDPYEVTNSLKTDLDKVAASRSQLEGMKKKNQEAIDECSRKSALKTSLFQYTDVLESVFLVFDKATEKCKLEVEEAKAKVARRKRKLVDATSKYMADSLLEKCAEAQGAAKGAVWRAHVRGMPSAFVTREMDLAQAKRDLKNEEETAEAVTYLFGFWEDLRDLLKRAQDQHEDYVQRQEAATKSDNDSMQKMLQEVDGKLISALELYFDASFRVQNDASSCLEPLLRTRMEMKRKFGGFLSVDPTETGVTQFKGVLDIAKKNDTELVELLLMLREANIDGYRKLHQKLTEAHPSMWREFQEALDKAELNRPGEQVLGSQEESESTTPCDDDAIAKDAAFTEAHHAVSDASGAEVAVDDSTPAHHGVSDGSGDEVAVDRSTPAHHLGNNEGFDFSDVGKSDGSDARSGYPANSRCPVM